MQCLLDFNRKAAELAGSISRNLKAAGQEIDPEDCMIAAIALLHHETLLTRNMHHFERIAGLKVKSY
ncbi:PIN domain-containing protein [Candidatus Woesearchaeota archaeon]|nr:PIN domain-containing protein [Candidatus Woesearchaeota archaeon]